MPIFQERQMCRCSHHAAEGFHSKQAVVHYAPDLSLEPKHLDIDLTVDPDMQSAEGTVTTTVVAHVEGVRTIELDAVDFDIAEVVDQSGEPLDFGYDGRKLKVTWSKPFAAGEERRVAVSYKVTEPVAGLYFSFPTAEYPDRPRWAATDHETERARYWLPCIDHLNVRTTLSFQLRARADYTILANGALQETVSEGVMQIAQWDLDFPCPSYILCFAIGEFTEKADGDFEGLPVAYYAAKHWTPEHLERSFGRTREMLEWMTKKLDRPFPFPKYYQFALPGIGGAMENISLVSWDDIFVLDEDLAREWTWLVDQINVHEMAHSYFGDAVVCRDFSHVWLKESWATYMEQCWLEDRYGTDEQQYDFYRNSHAYFGEADDSYKRPMVTRKFDISWDMYDRHLYPGGAARLHTLRNELGDEPFWSAVSAYLEENIGSVVETEDFRRMMERHSGRSLGQFFDQWFYTAGYPHLEVEFSYDAEKKEGTFSVEQKQLGEKRDGPQFALDLELAWTIGEERTVRKVRMDAPKRYFRFDMAEEPKLASVDPDGKTLHKQDFNPGDGKLRKQLEEGVTILERIRAAHELAKKPKLANVKAIADAYSDQPFWGVRQQFASALAAAGTSEAVAALAKIAADEENPMVIGHVLGLVGQFRDQAIWAATQQRLDRGDLPPWSVNAAWRVLGAQREDANLDALVEAAGVATIHDIGRRGAISGLAATRRAEAAQPLLELVEQPGVEYRARAAAASALGELGVFLEDRDKERVREKLEDIVRDGELPVARSAAVALATMGARESVGRVKQLAARISHQEEVAVRRVVERIYAGKDDKVAALEAQLGDMRAEYRKLVERLEKLEPADV